MTELRGYFPIIPAPNAPYRPRADWPLFIAVQEAALAHYREAVFPESLMTECGEHLAQMLERNYPANDMLILRRYGLTEEIKEQSVSIRDNDGHHWARAGIKLPRKVEVPRHGAANAESEVCKFDESNNWGTDDITAAGRAHNPGIVESSVKHNKKRAFENARWLVAKKFRPMFDEITTARTLHKRLSREASNLTDDLKAKLGRWPTWEEIESEIPAIGDFMAAERAKRASKIQAA
jgi:hypothetical protein